MPGRPLVPGDVVAGKYRIESMLGEGGMGYVLGARNIALDEPIAIKILRSDAVTNDEAVARFFREARASVRMKGEHVAKVLDVGSLDDGTPYMLMELLQGADLAAVVERHGCLPIPVAVDYVLQTCEALAEAHALGIVHRDIKPSNLFLTTGIDGSACVKVLDFGISKATNAIDAARPDFGLTQTQAVMGSPQYMAPEQMRSSRRVDGRTDIWGLGTILHELLTGAAPFEAQSMPELFAMILQDPAPSLRVRRPEISPALDAVVMRCLEKAPSARPENVLELARLLMPFASPASAGAAERVERVGRSVAFASASLIAERGSSRAVAGGLAGSAPSAPDFAHSNTTQLDPPAEPRTRRTALVVALAALGGLLLAGGVATAVVVARRADRTPSTGAVATPPSAPAQPAAPPPPPAIDPDPLPTPVDSPAVPPPSVAAASPPPAPSSAPAASARRPGVRPGPATPASGSSAPATASARAADPVKPAATASSRYD